MSTMCASGGAFVARLRHLVVVIPGIGGSVLSGPARSDGRHGGGYGLSGTLWRPDRLDLDRQPDLAPVGLVHDLALLPPLLTLPGYQRLGLHLRDAFDQVHIDTYDPARPVDPRTDVLLFPYDFRRSVAETSVRLAFGT